MYNFYKFNNGECNNILKIFFLNHPVYIYMEGGEVNGWIPPPHFPGNIEEMNCSLYICRPVFKGGRCMENWDKNCIFLNNV